jgi:plastocyanin
MSGYYVLPSPVSDHYCSDRKTLGAYNRYYGNKGEQVHSVTWRNIPMTSIRVLGIGLVALMFMGGCESTPTVTRTGDVKDVIIGDSLSAAEVSVNPGDEVRWINKRTAPVRIVFLDPLVNDKLSCKNNLGGWMSRSDTARLATNETASACFREVGQFQYTVRMDSGLTTGEINVPGVIRVGGKQGDAAAQTREQGKVRLSGQAVDRFSEPADAQSSGKLSAPPSSTSTTTTTTTTTPAK